MRFIRRRPLLRTAAIAGGAYGTHRDYTADLAGTRPPHGTSRRKGQAARPKNE